jgi:hypothetical protein
VSALGLRGGLDTEVSTFRRFKRAPPLPPHPPSPPPSTGFYVQKQAPRAKVTIEDAPKESFLSTLHASPVQTEREGPLLSPLSPEQERPSFPQPPPKVTVETASDRIARRPPLSGQQEPPSKKPKLAPQKESPPSQGRRQRLKPLPQQRPVTEQQPPPSQIDQSSPIRKGPPLMADQEELMRKMLKGSGVGRDQMRPTPAELDDMQTFHNTQPRVGTINEAQALQQKKIKGE